MKTDGQVAYEKWVETSTYINLSKWGDVDDEVKERWEEIALAVVANQYNLNIESIKDVGI